MTIRVTEGKSWSIVEVEAKFDGERRKIGEAHAVDEAAVPSSPLAWGENRG